jgi:hypothetical protein
LPDYTTRIIISSGLLNMKYGDFSSLVQLGVGLHIGTAILQLYGEIGAEPLVRTLARIKALVTEPAGAALAGAKADYEQLASDYEIFKIRLFNEYKRYIKINSTVAVLLTILLTAISFKSDDTIERDWVVITIPIVALSVLPALVTLGTLWIDASQLVGPMRARANNLEMRVLKLGLMPVQPRYTAPKTIHHSAKPKPLRLPRTFRRR